MNGTTDNVSDGSPRSTSIKGPDNSEILKLESEIVKQMYNDFYDDPKNVLALNACCRHDPLEVAMSRKRLEVVNNVFTHKVETEGKPMSNQKSTGTCWIYACLNAMRGPFMKAMNLTEFEFSQPYLIFWDKVERCNHFLHSIVKTAREPLDGRLVSFFLSDPIPDGGQWEMLVNLITKYGVMPKRCFPESFSAECSGRMNSILKSKLREYAKVLRDAITDGADDSAVRVLLNQQMSTIFRIVGICLGVPPTSFTWEFYQGKNNEYASIGPITPLEFYEQHVQPIFNVKEKVCLVTDARNSNPYNDVYIVEYLNNMVGGNLVLYNNQPIDVLERLAVESIKQGGESVWFGCDVAKSFSRKLGINDSNIHDLQHLFGIDVSLPLTRGERLTYHDSAVSHAMTLTGVSLDGNGFPTKWRVQNSWGEDRCDKGYITMDAQWFREYVFEIVVDRKFVPSEVLAVFEKPPKVLPPWDPMGILAQ